MSENTAVSTNLAQINFRFNNLFEFRFRIDIKNSKLTTVLKTELSVKTQLFDKLGSNKFQN